MSEFLFWHIWLYFCKTVLLMSVLLLFLYIIIFFYIKFPLYTRKKQVGSRAILSLSLLGWNIIILLNLCPCTHHLLFHSYFHNLQYIYLQLGEISLLNEVFFNNFLCNPQLSGNPTFERQALGRKFCCNREIALGGLEEDITLISMLTRNQSSVQHQKGADSV